MQTGQTNIAAATEADFNLPPQTSQRERSSAFPEELPQRPPRQAKTSGFRDCLSLRFFRSYNPAAAHNAKTRWRRIAMILTLLMAFSFMVLGLLVTSFWSLAATVVFSVVDAFAFWGLCWALAVIGDAEGSRKVMGINWNRKVFDGVIYASLLLYIGFFLIWFLVVGLFASEAFLLSLMAVDIGIAVIANVPPYQGF